MSNEQLIKTYGDHQYRYTSMLRHSGMVLAFAMDDRRQIYYSVLRLDQQSEAKGELDVNYWNENPAPLRFPGELAEVGYAIAGSTPLPQVKQGGRIESQEELPSDELDAFLSSTARLTALAPFQVLSDGKYVFVFRQCIDRAHYDAVFKLRDGRSSGDPGRTDYVLSEGDKIAICDSTLLCDRFILAGSELAPVREVRYRRSRNKTLPAGPKDTLGAEDMDGKPFFEATQELSFIRNLDRGRFAVLLLPTQVGELNRWQFFAYNPKSTRIDCFNVEQSSEGLFDTQGSTLYTSPDPQYQSAVLEREPGLDPFTGKDLIPLAEDAHSAETALLFNGKNQFMQLAEAANAPGFLGSAYTIEMWINPAQLGSYQTLYCRQHPGDGLTFCFSIFPDGRLALGYGTAVGNRSTVQVVAGKFQHVAVTNDGKSLSFYIDGGPAGTFPGLNAPTGSTTVQVGALPSAQGPHYFFNGVLDEIRIWNRVRSGGELQRDMMFRLAGNESGLAAYYRFDEGSGTKVYDHSPGGVHATLVGNPSWALSKAPISDRPGLRTDSIHLTGRTVESGLAALLYYQQETTGSSATAEAPPMKRQARVMLACATGGPDFNGAPTARQYLAVLDVGVSRDGYLALLPAELQLPPLVVDQQVVTLDEVAMAQQVYKQAETRVNAIQADLASIPGQLAQLRQQMAAAQNDLTQNWYRLEFGSDEPLLASLPKLPIAAQSTAEQASIFARAIAPTDPLGHWRYVRSGGGYLLVNRASGKYLEVNKAAELLKDQRGNLRLSAASLGAAWDIRKGPSNLPLLYNVTDNTVAFWQAGSSQVRVEPLVLQGSHAVRGIRLGFVTDFDQLLSDKQNQLTQQQAALISAQRDRDQKAVALGQLSKGLQGTAVSLPMKTLLVDRRGLPVSGALLGFAWSDQAPLLLDSTTGQVVLYFRGQDNGQFFAAYYDTTVDRLIMQLGPGDSGLRFVCSSAGLDLGTCAITVANGSTAATCTLAISCSFGSETWLEVPRTPRRLAEILAGEAQPEQVGAVAQLSGNVLVLQAGALRTLPAGSRLQLDDQVVQVAGNVAPAATRIPLTAPLTAAIAAGTPVSYLPYDYSTVNSDIAGANFSSGSLLFRPVPTLSEEPLKNGAAQQLLPSAGGSWHGDAPGRAFSFNGTSSFLRSQAGSWDRLGTPGDLSLEAWLRPELLSGVARVLCSALPAAPQIPAPPEAPLAYTLGLVEATPQTALALDGKTYVRCGTKLNLANTDFSIELWVRRTQPSRPECLLAHGPDVSAGRNTKLTIAFDPQSRLVIGFYGDDLADPKAVTDVAWNHFAVTCNSRSGEVILYRNGAEVSRRTRPAPYAGSGELVLGVESTATRQAAATCELDDVRLWSGVRTAADIVNNQRRRVPAGDDALLANWYFAGKLALDYTGRGSDGIVVGTPGFTTSPVSQGYRIFAGVGREYVCSRDVYGLGDWRHIAFTFEQSFGLRLSGGAYLDVEHDEGSNLVGDLTLEAALRFDRLGRPQPILCKGRLADGSNQSVPYCLGIGADGSLQFVFESAAGQRVSFSSTRQLVPGTFYRVAVVRRAGSSQRQSKSLMQVGSLPVEVVDSVEVRQWDDLRFYINGEDAGGGRYEGERPLGHSGALTLGRMTDAGSQLTLSGELAELRLWNRAREVVQLGKPVTANDRGLVARWHFSENQGNLTQDDARNRPARLRAGVRWVKTPDPQGSQAWLYVNGRSVAIDRLGEADPLRQASTAATGLVLGARLSGSGQRSEYYGGELEELRLWTTVRSEEQILDNLFTRLKGEQQDLIAYYTFDDDSTQPEAAQVTDNGLRGNDLFFSADGVRPAIVLSTAPVSNDTAEVRSALTGVKTPFLGKISATPGVAEYGDLQREKDGSVRGVLKRSYAMIQGGLWSLITGYKIGDLVSEWVGQAQFAPQVVGYMEGAPPIPAENVTLSLLSGGGGGTSQVAFNQSDSVTTTIDSSKTASLNQSFSVSLSSELSVALELILAPLGLGVSLPLPTGVSGTQAINTGFTLNRQWASTNSQSSTRGVGKNLSVRLTGYLEDDKHVSVPAVGRRYIAKNEGHALVQSQTADVYVMRLAHNQAFIGYRMTPNADLPPDWNLIPFPINPLYTKQGTLDGCIGASDKGKLFDPSYPMAAQQVECSYYKPREAYALRRRIMLEEQKELAYYDNYDNNVDLLGPVAEASKQARKSVQGIVGDLSGLSQMAMPPVQLPSISPRVAKRNIYNTYVWTAAGGLFTEEENTSDSVTETANGTFDLNVHGNSTTTLSGEIFGVTLGTTLDAQTSGSLNISSTKARSAQRSFTLNSSIDVPGNVQKYVPGKDSLQPVFDSTGQPVPAPGQVDAYRFMSFYLDSDRRNFQDLFGKVIDPIWLKQSNHPNAIALRQAEQDDKQPGCWRVLHRVTFASRILPPNASPSAPAIETAMRAQNVGSNFELIKRLEPYIQDHLTSRAELAAATAQALQAYLPEIVPHLNQVVGYLALYYGIE